MVMVEVLKVDGCCDELFGRVVEVEGTMCLGGGSGVSWCVEGS